jgi:hypothetical protein
MKYDMLDKESVRRVLDTFEAHSLFINKKYEAFKSKDNYWSSDRERFVGRFFKKYRGKFFILIDKEVIGYYDEYNDTGLFNSVDPVSIYSRGYNENFYHYRGERITRAVKKFLCVSYISAVNTSAGSGYIELSCYDLFGDKVNYILDLHMMANMQFKEITEEEFNQMIRLFQDDRDEREFKVTRYLDPDEMKARKKSLRKGLVKETITVMAKDSEAAYKKCTNAIEVEAC